MTYTVSSGTLNSSILYHTINRSSTSKLLNSDSSFLHLVSEAGCSYNLTNVLIQYNYKQ